MKITKINVFFFFVSIILMIIPIVISSKSINLVYYNNEVHNDSIFEEIFLFNGQDIFKIDSLFLNNDSLFLNTNRIDSLEYWRFSNDSLYQINAFGIVNNDSIKELLKNRKILIESTGYKKDGGFWNYIKKRRENRDIPSFLQKFDDIMKQTALISASTIIGLPIYLFITSAHIIYGIFDWSSYIWLTLWEYYDW